MEVDEKLLGRHIQKVRHMKEKSVSNFVPGMSQARLESIEAGKRLPNKHDEKLLAKAMSPWSLEIAVWYYAQLALLFKARFGLEEKELAYIRYYVKIDDDVAKMNPRGYVPGLTRYQWEEIKITQGHPLYNAYTGGGAILPNVHGPLVVPHYEVVDLKVLHHQVLLVEAYGAIPSGFHEVTWCAVDPRPTTR